MSRLKWHLFLCLLFFACSTTFLFLTANKSCEGDYVGLCYFSKAGTISYLILFSGIFILVSSALAWITRKIMPLKGVYVFSFLTTTIIVYLSSLITSSIMFIDRVSKFDASHASWSRIQDITPTNQWIVIKTQIDDHNRRQIKLYTMRVDGTEQREIDATREKALFVETQTPYLPIPNNQVSFEVHSPHNRYIAKATLFPHGKSYIDKFTSGTNFDVDSIIIFDTAKNMLADIKGINRLFRSLVWSNDDQLLLYRTIDNFYIFDMRTRKNYLLFKDGYFNNEFVEDITWYKP